MTKAAGFADLKMMREKSQADLSTFQIRIYIDPTEGVLPGMTISAYTRELATRIDASEYMRVTAIVNTPADPETFLYQDRAIAVVFFPQGLEKDRFTGTENHIGVFYDNTNVAQTAEIKEAMNELVALDNAAANGDTGSTNDGIDGGIQIADRNLFSPNGSASNGMALGFLFFFSSMFYTFATIGMIPRLRLTEELDTILRTGTPWDLILRILPYGALVIVSFAVGLAVLRIWGDLIFTGHLVNFVFVQIFYVFVLGMVTTLTGWTAANPGVAASRMILIIPGASSSAVSRGRSGTSRTGSLPFHTSGR